jgi:hypothetical protein
MAVDIDYARFAGECKHSLANCLSNDLVAKTGGMPPPKEISIGL